MPSAPEPARLSAPGIKPGIKLEALLAAAIGRPPADDERLAVGVSGGPDSLALLWLAAQAFPGRVTALTVDHGLRTGSAIEAADVATICARAGVLHLTLRWQGAKPQASLQAAARAARYRLMGNWCAENGASLLLTAHHADDGAETLLMRLQRGGGIGGLAGIRAARLLTPGVTLVRPLLGIRRADLAAVVAKAGWQAIDDPSNADPRHDRTAVRALLAANPALDVARLALSARHLADAEAALDWAARRAWAGAVVIDDDDVRLDVSGLPDEVVRRLVLRAITTLAPGAMPHGPALAALQQRLVAGGACTLAGIRARGGPIWRFTRAPPRRKQP